MPGRLRGNSGNDTSVVQYGTEQHSRVPDRKTRVFQRDRMVHVKIVGQNNSKLPSRNQFMNLYSHYTHTLNLYILARSRQNIRRSPNLWPNKWLLHYDYSSHTYLSAKKLLAKSQSPVSKHPLYSYTRDLAACGCFMLPIAVIRNNFV